MEKKQYVLRNWHYILFFFGVLFFVSCNSNEKAKIRIENIGLQNQKAFFEEQMVSGTKILDTLIFSGKGVLKYTVELKQPTFYTVRIPSGSDIFLLAFPGDKILVKANSENSSGISISGSSESEKLNKLYDSLFATRKILDSIRNKYLAAVQQVDKDSLFKQYIAITDNYRRFSMQFVLENLNSLVSIAALYQESGEGEYVFGRLRDMQFFKIVTDSLTKYFPKHPHVMALQRNFSLMNESYQLERIKASGKAINVGIPEILLPNTKGDTISLTSLKSKYVLLNFWDENSLSGNNYFPLLKGVFEKYQKKSFTIYNVYVGKSNEMWKKTVIFEEIGNWINVADTAFPYSKSRASYNVTSLPSNYLINTKEKNILQKDLTVNQLNDFLSQPVN